MASRREDCVLCGGHIYPDHAQGTATNTETGVNFMVCVKCDGATHTPLPDNADKWKQSRGILKDNPTVESKALKDFNAIWNNPKFRGEPCMVDAWNFVISHEEYLRELLENADKS